MTKPLPVSCPPLHRVISSYKIDIKEAIELFKKATSHTDCGDTFADIKLFWLVPPDLKDPHKKDEPCWYFRLTLGNEIIIGANTGTIYSCHKLKELLKKE